MTEEMFSVEQESRSESEKRQLASLRRKKMSNKTRKTRSRYRLRYVFSSSSILFDDDKEYCFAVDDSSNEEELQQHLTVVERKKGLRNERLSVVKSSDSAFN